MQTAQKALWVVFGMLSDNKHVLYLMIARILKKAPIY